ncbi:MAG: HEAT repeat domain-containing protein [Polyangiales bacterium]
MQRATAWCVVVMTCGVLGCAGSTLQTQVQQQVERGEYAAALQLYERDGRDASVLRAFSESLLLEAARSSDPAQHRSAFVELGLLGRRADGLLEQLAEPAEPGLVRAEALRILTALGDGGARSELRSLLANPDADVVDRAYSALDPEHDRALLVPALAGPRLPRRRAALQCLGRTDTSYFDALREVARLDPDPPLRAAALSALERYGRAALPPLEAAFTDPDEQVRATALAGFARVAAPEDLVRIDGKLGSGSNTESVALAGALLHAQTPHDAERAWAVLRAGLSALDPALRARSTSALFGLPLAPADRALVHQRLASEHVPGLKLLLALVLDDEDDAARVALRELSQSADLTGVEAAAQLAKHAPDAGQAKARLHALRTHTSPLVRASVARQLGRELGEPAAVASLLADPTWQVRHAAAGAVLRAL